MYIPEQVDKSNPYDVQAWINYVKSEEKCKHNFNAESTLEQMEIKDIIVSMYKLNRNKLLRRHKQNKVSGYNMEDIFNVSFFDNGKIVIHKNNISALDEFLTRKAKLLFAWDTYHADTEHGMNFSFIHTLQECFGYKTGCYCKEYSELKVP